MRPWREPIPSERPVDTGQSRCRPPWYSCPIRRNNLMTAMNTPYQLLGGEPGLRKLANTFYDIMDSLPEAAEIRAMHGGDLDEIKEKLFEYLSGWMGGPPL